MTVTSKIQNYQDIATETSLSAVCCSIKEWKKTLRRKKKQHTVERLEEASEEVWSMDDINIFLDNQEVWSFMDHTLKSARKGHHVSRNLKFISRILMPLFY